jgi:hypothetical protein
VKNIEEIYQALLYGKKLRHNVTENVVYLEDGNLTDVETFDKPEDWEVCDGPGDKLVYCKLKKEHDAGIHVSPIYRVGSMQYNEYISLGYEPFNYTTYEELK